MKEPREDEVNQDDGVDEGYDIECDLKAELSGFVAKDLLSEESAWPAAKEFEGMKHRFADAPACFWGGSFVNRIAEECYNICREQETSDVRVETLCNDGPGNHSAVPNQENDGDTETH